jgi:hypothetical protein
MSREKRRKWAIHLSPKEDSFLALNFMIEADKKKLWDDVSEFLVEAEKNEQKTYCLKLTIRNGRYTGSGLEIHKPCDTKRS